MRIQLLVASLLVLIIQTQVTGQDRSKSVYLLSGAVTLSDGRPVSEPVEVLLNCSGVPFQKVFSQADGQFSFTLADNKSPISGNDETAGSPIGGGFQNFNQMGRGFGDRGEHGSGRSSKFGRIYLGDCEIVAMLPGFTSDVIYPGTRDVMDNPDVGTIKLHRRAGVRGTTVSLNSLNAPEKARNAYNSGREELRKKDKNYSKAAKEFKKAVDAYPQFAAAWNYLGECKLAQKESDQARTAFEKSIAADPDYLLPYLKIAELDVQNGRLEEAARWSSAALERNREWTRVNYVHAYANLYLGRLDIAEEAIRKVHASPEASAYPMTNYWLGGILAARGEIPAAAEQFRRFLDLNPGFEASDKLKAQLASWVKKGIIQEAAAPTPKTP